MSAFRPSGTNFIVATDAEFAIGSVEGEIAEMKIEALVNGRLSDRSSHG
jgi:hypothetical protein